MTDDRIIDVTENVKWIGVLDYDIQTFDIVMTTEFGTTYNSYFINAGKKALIDLVKEKFSDIYLKKLRSVTDPAEIQYVILDHTEPDHSGSLKLLLEINPSVTVVGSGNAIRYLKDIVNIPFKSLIVKDGDTLDLGNRTLRFISAPNLHWPDSIYTYLEEEKILFTCDSFGAHYCDPELYSRLTDDYKKAYKYYFNVILKPFSRFMLKAIEKIRPLEIKMICPGHGPVHRDNVREIIDITADYAGRYVELISARKVRKVLVAYVSAYGYTKMASEYIASGILESDGLSVETVDIEKIPEADLDSKLTEADAILIGSPTINQNTLLPVYRLFALINPLRDKGKPAGAFGSYGWSGEATKIITENLRNLRLKVLEEPAGFKFFPAGSKKDDLIDFGRRFARAAIEAFNEIKNPGD
ncbi:MAG: FprA family A-type flavoprotein [Bacteroidota bacterium]|nr:FprA family A-type flavoprotein [Bacteroidota bacterium]